MQYILPLCSAVILVFTIYRMVVSRRQRHETDTLVAREKERMSRETQTLSLSPAVLAQLSLSHHQLHIKWDNKDEEIPNFYDCPICLNCGSTVLLTGPSGGMSTNMRCSSCGHTYNCMFMPGGVIVEPI